MPTVAPAYPFRRIAGSESLLNTTDRRLNVRVDGIDAIVNPRAGEILDVDYLADVKGPRRKRIFLDIEKLKGLGDLVDASAVPDVLAVVAPPSGPEGTEVEIAADPAGPDFTTETLQIVPAAGGAAIPLDPGVTPDTADELYGVIPAGTAAGLYHVEVVTALAGNPVIRIWDAFTVTV